MRIQAAIAVVLAGYAGAAAAADWRVEPRVDLTYTADDNNRMTSVAANEISVSGAELDALLSIIALTPQSTFRMVPRIRTTYYPDEPDDEVTDGFLRMNWDYRGERSRSNVDVNYAHRTVLGRFFPDGATPDDGGLGEPDPGSGSGRTADPTDQDDLQIRPRFIFEMTERTALVARLLYQDVQFDEQELDDRVDFTNSRGELGLRYQTSPTATLTFMGGASLYEPETGLDSDGQYATLEWANDVSDTSRIFFRGGANRVKTDGAADPDWQTGFNGGAGIQWQFEVTELFLEYNHYMDPSTSGQMINRDQFRGQVVHQLSEKSYLNFAGRAVRDQDPGSNGSFVDREFLSASIGYEWRFARQFSAVAGYEVNWQSYEDEPRNAVSNRFYLGASWQPRRRDTRLPEIKAP